MRDLAIGIDIGGTNTVIGVVDKEGKILQQSQISTQQYPILKDYVQILSLKINEYVNLNTGNIIGVGIGAPDVNQFQNTIEFAHNLPWKGIVPLGKLLMEKIQLPVQLMNDANAATIGEMTFGVAKKMQDFILITLGTGLGSGIVANGELILGHDGLAGELGHVIIKDNGRPCGCGRKGCLETYVSATGLIRTALNFLEQKKQSYSSLRKTNPQRINGKLIVRAANNKDPIAMEAIDYTAQLFGKALANFVTFSSPEAIILFGGIVNAGEIFLTPVRHYMNKYLLDEWKDRIKLLASGLANNDAAILGAASLVWLSHTKP